MSAKLRLFCTTVQKQAVFALVQKQAVFALSLKGRISFHHISNFSCKHEKFCTSSNFIISSNMIESEVVITTNIDLDPDIDLDTDVDIMKTNADPEVEIENLEFANTEIYTIPESVQEFLDTLKPS